MTGAAVVRLRIVSYNVHSLRDDLGAMTAVVRGLDPDVLVLQEAPRRWRWRSRSARLARDFGLVVAAGGLPALGNLILTSLRVRVHEARAVRYPLTPGRHLRGAAIAVCSVGRTRFAVVGSHLATDATERPAQAARLRAEMSTLDVPVVLAGDWNESPDGPAWPILSDGLVDAAVATENADRHTFPCAQPRNRLDAMFVDPRFTVTGYDVVDTPAARRASDHFPVLVDLALPVPATTPG